MTAVSPGGSGKKENVLHAPRGSGSIPHGIGGTAAAPEHGPPGLTPEDKPRLMKIETAAESSPCFCGGTSYEPILRGNHDRLVQRDYPFTVVRCRSCDLARTLPVPDIAQYSEGYALTTEDGRFVGSYDDTWSRNIVRYVCENATGHRLLDIGAHVGNLVAAASELGLDAQGIDPDPVATRAGRQLGRNLVTGTIEDVSGPFDIVVINQVLEHIHNLRGFLQNLARILIPEGYAFIFVPCYTGLMARIMKDRWIGWFPTQHVWHFTPATLAAVVHDASPLRLTRYTTNGVIEPPSTGIKGCIKAMVERFSRVTGWGDQIEAIFQQPANTGARASISQ